jgi:DNA-binding Lrp family transcriptional regulator
MERAFVCVTARLPSMQKVVKEIKAVDGVESTYVMDGAYDLCFDVQEDNLDELKYVIEKITRMNDVRASLTLFRG